ncbi:hypothetical protein VNN41_05635 [Lactococcus garvieae]|uniref:hypothetical protein n=1 Tax=Lactococcus garvieae TaxID=1363 RepID=UPI00324B033A
MSKLKRVLVLSVFVLIAGGVGGVTLIKTLSTEVSDEQRSSLYGSEEETVPSLKPQQAISVAPSHTYKKKEFNPVALDINHGMYPAQIDLQSYLWWSEDSQNKVRFTETQKQIIDVSDEKTLDRVVSQFPYRVVENILYYDYSQIDNPENIEEYPSMVMSWDKNKLIFTPNDDKRYKEERGETLIAIEQIK